MLEMVESRRNADNGEQRNDLFSGLLDAAQNELDSEATLTDEELIGGIAIVQHLRKVAYSFQETCLFFFLLDMR